MAEPPIFVDTGYLVAILNRRDGLHEQATALAKKWAKKNRALLTSDPVLIELANFFARSSLRTRVHAAVQKIRTARGWRVEPLEAQVLARAERRYGKHSDKKWSLTDCISMEMMTDYDAVEVATADKHFQQAGYNVLLR
jgi:uncharacterized protein